MSGSNDKYKFDILNGSVLRVYEYEHGRLELEDMDDDEQWSFIDGNVVKTEFDDGRLEHTFYADLNGDGFYSKIRKTYGPLNLNPVNTSPVPVTPTGNQSDSTSETTPDGYQFETVNGIVTAIYEIKDGYRSLEIPETDESWAAAGSIFVKTETEYGLTVETTYADSNGDGVYSPVNRQFQTEGREGGVTNSQASMSHRLDDAYRFTIENGVVVQVFEYDDGVFKAERMDTDESWQVVDATVVKTEYEHGFIEQSTYTDADGDGIYTKAGKSYGLTGNSALSGATSTTGFVGTGVAEGYKFDIANGVITQVYEVEHGQIQPERMHAGTTWALDGDQVIKTEYERGLLEKTVFADADGDGVYTKIAKSYASPINATSFTSDADHLSTGYRFDVSGDSVTQVYEVVNGISRMEESSADESWSVSGSSFVKTETKHGVTQVSTYADTDGDGIYTLSGRAYSTSGTTGSQGNALPAAHPESEGYIFEVTDGAITAVFEIEAGVAVLEHDKANVTWETDGTTVTKIEYERGIVEQTSYADSDGDGVYTKTGTTYRLPEGGPVTVQSHHSHGSDDDDVWEGTHQDDYYYGSSGHDAVSGSYGDDDLVGGHGDDTLHGGIGSDILTAGEGHDFLCGEADDDYLYGGAGDDVVDGGDGDDLIIGGDGQGNDVYVGGRGVDTVKYTSATSGITIDLASGEAHSSDDQDLAQIGFDKLSEIENVIAGDFDDVITGDDTHNELHGEAGNDSLFGGSGDDVIFGGDGDDYLDGGTGNNMLSGGAGNDSLIGEGKGTIALYTGSRDDYKITLSEHQLLIEDLRADSPDGTDVLTNINLLRFDDRTEFFLWTADRSSNHAADTDGTIAVTENKIYSGTRLAETFEVADGTSAMILAGKHDVIHLSGLLSDYSYEALGSQLQIFSGTTVTTVNVGGEMELKTASGSVDLSIHADGGTAQIMLGGQALGTADFDMGLLVDSALM